ncbi:MAG: hypothetical protein ACLUHK_08145 [Eubacteriales bacterium]|jgi:hypothetical protein
MDVESLLIYVKMVLGEEIIGQIDLHGDSLFLTFADGSKRVITVE